MKIWRSLNLLAPISISDLNVCTELQQPIHDNASPLLLKMNTGGQWVDIQSRLQHFFIASFLNVVKSESHDYLIVPLHY